MVLVVITEKVALSGRGLGLGVGWPVGHADSIEDVKTVLGLGEEEAARCARDLNAEEIVHWSFVLDGEGGLDASDDVLEKSWSRGRENHVLDVEE